MSVSISNSLPISGRHLGIKQYLGRLFRALFLFSSAFLLVSCGALQQTAKEAYLYAVPAVEHNKLFSSLIKRQVFINNISSDSGYSDGSAVVATNIDTLYTFGVLDIREEPVVITIDNSTIEEDRYYSIQLLDIFTNAQYLGPISNRTEGSYLIAREDWNGTKPDGIKEVIKIPATVVFALGRIQLFDLTDDKEIAEDIADNAFKVSTLSAFSGTPPPRVDTLDWTAPLYDSKTGDIEGFFQTFNYIVQYQLLSGIDDEVLKGFEALHLGANETFSKDNFTALEWLEIEAGVLEAKLEILLGVVSSESWSRSPANVARWGDDYIGRAVAAWVGLYGNTKEESVYLSSLVDSKGRLYSGSHDYTLTISEDDVENIKYFWSLTLYDLKGFFAPNELDRYAIRSFDNLTKDANGTFTLYIQHENPGTDKENNWLPSPEGNFYLLFRIYGESEETVLDPVVRED